MKKTSGSQNRKRKRADENEKRILSHSLMKFLNKDKGTAVSAVGSTVTNVVDLDVPIPDDFFSLVTDETVMPEEGASTSNCSQLQNGGSYAVEADFVAEKVTDKTDRTECGKEDLSSTFTEAEPLHNTHFDDPSLGVPTNDVEKRIRVERGPYQLKLEWYPRTKIGDRMRSFQKVWFDKYQWLEYSNEVDRAFCFCCRFFPAKSAFGGSTKGHINDAFILNGFKNWKKAVEALREHENSLGHKSSALSWKEYMSSKGIDEVLDNQRTEHLAQKEVQRMKNRDLVKRLVDIVLYLSKGGHPFRGHNEKDNSLDKGAFLELVELLARYDPLLKEHLESGPRNAQYLSSKIQNDLIASLHSVLFRQIAADIQGKKISIIADETSDVGHHEQMSIVVRYFCDKKNGPLERLVAFRRLRKMDAQSIFIEINFVITELHVKWSNVEAVCFDGASVMSGERNGVQAKCKEMNPNIVFIHCYAHCLNLALVDTCVYKEQNSEEDKKRKKKKVDEEIIIKRPVRNDLVHDFFAVVQMTYKFMERSTVRHSVLEEMVTAVKRRLITLKSLSTTRWACRAEAVSAIRSQFEVILKAIETIKEDSKSPECNFNAGIILENLRSFKFIMAMEIMNPILQLVVKVSKYLQTCDLNLVTAMAQIKNLKSALQDLRSEEEFRKLYDAAVKICAELNIQVPEASRRRVSKKLDDNPQNQHFFPTIQEQIRVQNYIPALDTLVTALNQRFSHDCVHLISSVGKLIELKADEDDCKIICNSYHVTMEELCAELRLLKSEQTLPVLLSSLPQWFNWLLQSERATVYSTFTKVLKCFLTIPVSSCSCERCFSKLTHVKSKLRQTMTQDRLEHLMLPYVEQDLVAAVSMDEVIDTFKVISPVIRRMPL